MRNLKSTSLLKGQGISLTENLFNFIVAKAPGIFEKVADTAVVVNTNEAPSTHDVYNAGILSETPRAVDF